MANDVYEFLDSLPSRERLTLSLRIQDGPGYAPLGVDALWLRNFLFCAGVAEVSAAYAAYVMGQEMPRALAPEMMRDFRGALSSRMGGPSRSWVDVYEEDQEFCASLFRVQLQRRQGGLWAVGDGEILRLELVSVSRENPTVLKIIATGAVAAMLTLGGCFVGVQVIKEHGAAQCRQQYLDFADKQTERILRTGKFEGRFTKEHQAAMADLQDMVKSGIAACGSSLTDADISVTPKESEIGIHIGGARPGHRPGDRR